MIPDPASSLPSWPERFAAALDGAISHHSSHVNPHSVAVMAALIEVRDALRESLKAASGWKS